MAFTSDDCESQATPRGTHRRPSSHSDRPRTPDRRSPIRRIGRDQFVRNVLYAVGNSGDAALLPAAERLREDASEVVRDAAGWAVGRLRAL